MTNPQPTEENKVTPWRCVQGAVISGALAVALYYLMSSIAFVYATKPVNFTNPIAINIAVAVRTLVIGIAALGAGVFAIVTVGLIALGIQLLFQGDKQKN